jgi:hypothetical protein
VLVTEFVRGAPRAERRDAIRAGGGLRRLGEMFGELQALPADGGATARPGGAWHHLADGTPQAEISAGRTLLAECEDSVAAADRQNL